MKNALVILSHVSHGYVGNRAMTFPLQVMGWDVDLINTTNFSNHPGYGRFKGKATKGDDMLALFEGLSKMGRLSRYQMIVTGYVPNEELLQILFDQIIKKVFNKNSSSQSPQWIVDPVLGDNGKLYVLEKVVPIYRELLSSGYVSCITPNQFEFETISGYNIADFKSLRDALDKFYLRYCIPNVVILSIELNGSLYGVGFHAQRKENSIFLIPIERIPVHFFGCGDLFTALLSARFQTTTEISVQVLGNVLHKLTRILRLSLDIATERNGDLALKVVQDIQVVALQPYLLDTSEILIENAIYI